MCALHNYAWLQCSSQQYTKTWQCTLQRHQSSKSGQQTGPVQNYIKITINETGFFFFKLSAIWQHLDLIIFMSMTFYGLTLKSMKISSDSPWAMSTAVIICFSPTRCKPSMHSLIQIYRFQPSSVYRPVNSSVTTGASNSEWLTKLVSCQHSWFSTFGHVGHDQN